VAGIEDGTITVATTFRVVTDGTLRDALLTAIRGRQGPDGLRPGPDEAAILPLTPSLFSDDHEELPSAVATERDRLLAPIGDPRLRAHLWSPYLDRPWDRADDGTIGATSTVPPGWQSLTARPGTTFIAAWDLAYFGEVSLAVMRTDGALPTVESAGGTVPGRPNDMPWGQRVAHVLDPDGNMLNLTKRL